MSGKRTPVVAPPHMAMGLAVASDTKRYEIGFVVGSTIGAGDEVMVLQVFGIRIAARNAKA